jgi:hypothetical protein
MFPDKQKTYPGRKFVQALQVGLVIAIGVFGVMSLVPHTDSPTPIPTSVPLVVPTLAVPVVPDNGALDLYDEALAVHDQGDYAQAIDLYTQALELDPTIVNAWLGRGVAYEQSGTDVRLSRNDFWRYLQHLETERIERDIKANQPLALTMEEGRVFALSFEAKAGDVVNITANSLKEGEPEEPDVVDPLMVLLFDGAPMQADDDTLRSDGTLINMNSHIDDYDVTRDGTYTILLSHAGGGSYGMVDVTLTVR